MRFDGDARIQTRMSGHTTESPQSGPSGVGWLPWRQRSNCLDAGHVGRTACHFRNWLPPVAETNRVVNPKGSVKRRSRELWRVFGKTENIGGADARRWKTLTTHPP
jgi:hypothetical protein